MLKRVVAALLAAVWLSFFCAEIFGPHSAPAGLWRLDVAGPVEAAPGSLGQAENSDERSIAEPDLLFASFNAVVVEPLPTRYASKVAKPADGSCQLFKLHAAFLL